MLKFFRNIRQKLLVENRFNKYLLYATGEIILVVIGILIAENLAPTLKPACRTGWGRFSGFELLNIILV